MKHLCKRSLLSIAVVAAIGGFSAPTLAQSTADEEIEKIEVKGFRGSLIKGRDLKRDAVGAQDSIVAEDIADFPDLNLAEALQRIPGIAITRDGGEGRRIALRGLDSNFSLVQLNGMDVLGNTDTAMDSRSQGSRDRAFDFNLFAAEMFNQIDVKKSYSASQDEGGMAGTVGLRTAKPFDFGGFNAAVSAQVGSNQYTNDIAPRTAVMLSNTWGNFGALASVAFSKRDTEEKGSNTYRWRQRRDDEGPDKTPGSTRGVNISESDFNAITSGTVTAPRGNRYSVWQNSQERLGITTALQYRGDDFEIVADFLYGELTNDRNEYHLNPRNNEGSMPYGKGVTINEVVINSMNELVYGDYSNSVINTESRQHDIGTEFTQAVISGRWDINERLTARGLIGTETSDLRTNSFKFYTETRADVVVDHVTDRFFGNYTYGQDMTDSNRWWFQEVDVRTKDTESKNFTTKVDFDYMLNDTDTLRFGLSKKTLENAVIKKDVGNILRDKGDNGHALLQNIPSDAFITIDSLGEAQWAVVDVGRVIGRYDEIFNPKADLSADDLAKFQSELAKFAQLDNGRIHVDLADSLNRIKETTFNAYVEYQWDRDIGDMPFRGNIGLRYYETDTDTIIDFQGAPVEVPSTYDGILPAANFVLEPMDDILVRFSYSQNITRPSYDSLSKPISVSVKDDDVTVKMSNPYLQPYMSDNYDISVEWYFDEVGYLAAAYYRKDLEDYIFSAGFGSTVADVGVPQTVQQEEGLTANQAVLVERQINGEEATLDGIEISFQRDFDFLPAPFNNMGIVSNFTFANGSINQYTNSGTLLGEFDFPNLSDRTSSITLYYETDDYGIRFSQNYRSDYITGAGLGGSDEDVRGFHASTFYDLSAFYQVNDALKVSLEGSNLTNERDEQFSDSANRLYNTTTSGRTWYAGFTYQF